MTHLSPEDLDHLLTHPNPADPHLLACEPCRRELAGLQASVSGLRQSLTALAAATPLRLPQPKPTRAAVWVFATACCALACAAAAVPAFHHQHPTTAAPQAQQQTDQEDEALLQGIHQDLATPVAPPLTPLAIETH